MNIGIICYPSYGGSGVVATELGKQLARRGHRVHVISYDLPFRLSPEHNLFFHEVEVLSYPLFKFPPYLLALTNKMVEVATYEKLDIIHVHYAIPHAASAYLCRQMMGPGAPRIITTLHGTDITLLGSDPSFKRIVEFCINQSDGVTAVSEQLRASTLELFSITREIVTIYNFVDLDEFRRVPDLDGLKRRYAPSGEKVVIHISNFRPVKRVTNVVKVFAELRKRVPAVLLMVGDGPESYPAHQHAERLGIQDSIHFLGQRERVQELLSVADLLLLPSVHESFGLVALEAMACEVPVVASRVGGLPEVVAHGQTGYLCDPDDLESMARAGVRLLMDDRLRRRVAAAGRARAESMFGAERIVPLYEEHYRRVAGGR